MVLPDPPVQQEHVGSMEPDVQSHIEDTSSSDDDDSDSHSSDNEDSDSHSSDNEDSDNDNDSDHRQPQDDDGDDFGIGEAEDEEAEDEEAEDEEAEDEEAEDAGEEAEDDDDNFSRNSGKLFNKYALTLINSGPRKSFKKFHSHLMEHMSKVENQMVLDFKTKLSPVPNDHGKLPKTIPTIEKIIEEKEEWCQFYDIDPNGQHCMTRLCKKLNVDYRALLFIENFDSRLHNRKRRKIEAAVYNRKGQFPAEDLVKDLEKVDSLNIGRVEELCQFYDLSIQSFTKKEMISSLKYFCGRTNFTANNKSFQGRHAELLAKVAKISLEQESMKDLNKTCISILNSVNSLTKKVDLLSDRFDLLSDRFESSDDISERRFSNSNKDVSLDWEIISWFKINGAVPEYPGTLGELRSCGDSRLRKIMKSYNLVYQGINRELRIRTLLMHLGFKFPN